MNSKKKMCIYIKERYLNNYCVDEFFKVKFRLKIEYINILNEFKVLV